MYPGRQRLTLNFSIIGRWKPRVKILYGLIALKAYKPLKSVNALCHILNIKRFKSVRLEIYPHCQR